MEFVMLCHELLTEAC